MPNLNDDTRTAKPVRVIACGMIAREILDICTTNGLDHIDLKCLPADYHHHPEKIVPHMRKAIAQARLEGFENIFAGYADCGTGGQLDTLCREEGIARLDGPHCFSFYFGNKAFEDSDGAFLTHFIMTDFLARHFETFMVRPLGLDKHPELKEIYFSNYTHMTYFVQIPDPELEAKARKAAIFLGLEFQMIETGYGDLAPALKALSI